MNKLRIFAAAAFTAVALVGGAASAVAGPGPGGDGAFAEGYVSDEPGVGTGNLVQAPVHAEVHACGNTVSVVGALNPAEGNLCVNK
ncbi:chaplin [Streptomyces sp. NPDC050658]|uniref:chaplin n=1 Tax=unclassified Streptomyces TaxID=2593676 RepID=UPI003438BBCC